MRHGSLFSGGGGFDLASEWMGWENKFNCEWDEFCKRILNYYWPNAESYNDIDKADFTKWRGVIDVLTGGPPCQPYSTAGRRKGKEDNRHKWPQMLRAVREIQPPWVVVENVRGITNWNGGLVFNEIQADLEAEGYEVTPFLLPTCAVNAPHRRERIWFIAHSSRNGYSEETRLNQDTGTNGTNKSKENKRERVWNDINGNGKKGIITNANGIGQSESWKRKFTSSETENRHWETSWSVNVDRWPTQSPVFIRDDGFPGELDGIAVSDWLEGSHKMIGNAIVPQMAYEIFKAIEQYEKIK